ncbi:hypothetical protein KPH14_007059 [Odynerus spinipes]|uniref:Uncharacterized protein n=1 Tax=Odynerus spinipes TaxID=1348599 RepID=A0AAD9RRY1_9HYME|nr:hypothetical protein KPH14_007059 [Odynerus spinipes]
MSEIVSAGKPDPEFNWIFRTCSNACNVYLTMLQLIIYDNALNMQLDNLQALSYPTFLVFVDLLVYMVLQ